MTAQRDPNLATIGGRLRVERNRLGMSQPAFGALAAVTKGAVLKWENGHTAPNAVALQSFAEGGIDVLYVITARRAGVAPQPLAGVTVRQALAMLDPADRHRLLLDLLADELRG